MAHSIQGIIAAHDLLAVHAAALAPRGVVIELGSGFGMLLLKVSRHDPADIVSQTARKLSGHGRVAEIGTEYFGGHGRQYGALWEGGSLIVEPEWSTGRPINAVLARLGVMRSAAQDEFAILGLDRYRSNDRWLTEAAARRRPE